MRQRHRLQSIPGGQAKARQRRTRARASLKTIVIVGFAVAILLIAGFGFTYKMTEFAMTIIKDDIEGFGAAAIGVYLIGMLPIVFLTLWAVFTGRFRDIERPKFRMLELDREIERGGELGEHHA
jgi:hypothetical protein